MAAIFPVYYVVRPNQDMLTFLAEHHPHAARLLAHEPREDRRSRPSGSQDRRPALLPHRWRQDRGVLGSRGLRDGAPPAPEPHDSIGGCGFLRRLGEVDRAVEEAQRGFSVEPTWISAVTLGEALRLAGRRKEAITAFAEATTLDEKDASAWVELSELHSEAEDVEASMKAAVEALARDPNLPEARRLIAAARTRLNDRAKGPRMR